MRAVLAPFATAAALCFLAPYASAQISNPQPGWNVTYHGACCEANLAAEGDNTYVLAPVLVDGNKIIRSTDGGANWQEVYPPAPASVPYGIEGDLHAWGDDVVYFGTQLAQGVAAFSSDKGDNWTVVEIAVPFPANDQAWAYLGPIQHDSCLNQTKPYVLAGWYRIGSVALFSCDGGLTWPVQTPLVGNNGNGPIHIVCQQEAHAPAPAGDTRIADANFHRMKAGRHGNWGPDKDFYWTETDGTHLYVCSTPDFGVNWDGVAHPLPPDTPNGITVALTAFDNLGTLYVMHAGRLYVSIDNGESFAHTHDLPRWGNADTGDGGSAEYFVVEDGNIHLAVSTPSATLNNGNDVWYLYGANVDTANPIWHEELVDIVPPDGNTPVRLDFMQIAVDDNGVPTLGYTTTGSGDTTTASRASAIVDTDADGLADVLDNCAAVANADQADIDGDAIGDACDNCITASNSHQCDTNADGYGNACDADLNNNGVINFVDLGIMKASFFSSPGDADWNADADLTCNDVINFIDLGLLKGRFFEAPGPSALAP